jgi:Coproporphyrinogen III oxidase and related Fe-S oxidoreductases
MSLLSDIVIKPVRSHFTGRGSRYIFEPSTGPISQKIDKLNLYIHIPFCKNTCPYCPYNKIEYDKELVGPYFKAVLNEIKLYRDLFGRFEVSSIYIGGGTPALLIDELKVILEEIGNTFTLNGDICIETNPNDITDELVRKLKECKIQLVSLGVQSFQNENLCFIGRNYKASILSKCIERLTSADFKSVNLDMIFALPGQDMKNLSHDLAQAVDCGADQITTYPLFTFPYTSVGSYLKLKKVRMPNLKQRKKMYYYINDFLLKKGFNRVSVWGFKKGDVPRYSSVTRDNYIGIGAGAGSHLSDGFYLNTFSVPEYINRCLSKTLPTALYMNFNKDMQNYFWLYWRLYDTQISKSEVFRRFGSDRAKVTRLIELFKTLKLAEENADVINLNLKGAFWIHLLQNYLSLNYINKIWAVAMRDPFPPRIAL